MPLLLEVLVRDNVVVAHHFDWMALQEKFMISDEFRLELY